MTIKSIKNKKFLVTRTVTINVDRKNEIGATFFFFPRGPGGVTPWVTVVITLLPLVIHDTTLLLSMSLRYVRWSRLGTGM